MYKPCLALLVVAACGSSSDDWVPSDIDTDQTVDRLGAAGYAKLCGAFEDYVRDEFRSNRLIQAACTYEALQTTPDAIACGEAVDACLDQLPPTVEAQLEMILDQAGCNALAITQTGCAAKVSEVTACLDALGAQLDTLELSATCAAFGSPVPADWWQIEPPAECTALSAEC
ncbi:MAG TPA: hypothetical protein VFQ53_33145 [Kofleriaceae bacterium]|nr:hypothetical protein [Kofleriaceae bacterium]